MRIIRIVIGIAGIGLAALLCTPLAGLVWVTYVKPNGHTDFMFSDGSHTISGWQMWMLLTVLASLGGAILGFSIYALISKKDDT